jgi:hypothetical protein
MAKASARAVIDGSAEAVWKVAGEFGGIAGWHPAITTSDFEPGKAGDTAGSIRVCALENGANLREEQVARSDAERYYSYNFLEAPIPVENYLGNIRVFEEGTGRARVEWTSTFDCAAEAETEMVDMFAGIYQAGLDALKGRFGA